MHCINFNPNLNFNCTCTEEKNKFNFNFQSLALFLRFGSAKAYMFGVLVLFLSFIIFQCFSVPLNSIKNWTCIKATDSCWTSTGTSFRWLWFWAVYVFFVSHFSFLPRWTLPFIRSFNLIPYFSSYNKYMRFSTSFIYLLHFAKLQHIFTVETVRVVLVNPATTKHKVNKMRQVWKKNYKFAFRK